VSALRKIIASPSEFREPLLRLVDRAGAKSEARRRLIVTLSITAVVLTLFAVALVQARLVQSQRDIDVLNAKIVLVEAERAQLARDVIIAESPAGILDRADQLGMVKAVEPVHLTAIGSEPGEGITK
jgi:cell division protein FtsL